MHQTSMNVQIVGIRSLRMPRNVVLTRAMMTMMKTSDGQLTGRGLHPARHLVYTGHKESEFILTITTWVLNRQSNQFLLGSYKCLQWFALFMFPLYCIYSHWLFTSQIESNAYESLQTYVACIWNKCRTVISQTTYGYMSIKKSEGF